MYTCQLLSYIYLLFALILSRMDDFRLKDMNHLPFLIEPHPSFPNIPSIRTPNLSRKYISPENAASYILAVLKV